MAETVARERVGPRSEATLKVAQSGEATRPRHAYPASVQYDMLAKGSAWKSVSRSAPARSPTCFGSCRVQKGTACSPVGEHLRPMPQGGTAASRCSHSLTRLRGVRHLTVGDAEPSVPEFWLASAHRSTLPSGNPALVHHQRLDARQLGVELACQSRPHLVAQAQEIGADDRLLEPLPHRLDPRPGPSTTPGSAPSPTMLSRSAVQQLPGGGKPPTLGGVQERPILDHRADEVFQLALEPEYPVRLMPTTDHRPPIHRSDPPAM